MAKKSKKFILDVVPLTQVPLIHNQSFSYLADEELPAGTLVYIPLFHRDVEGIVWNSKKDFKRLSSFKLKKIKKVLEKHFLDEKQLKLAQFISNYYFSSLGIILKGFVPKRVKAHKIKKISESHISKQVKLTQEQKLAVKQITQSKLKIKNRSFLLFGPSGSGKTEVYIHSILKLQEKNKNLQYLILVPELTLTPQAVERYGAYFKIDEIALLTSNLSKGQFYHHWQKIKSGKAKIIIGTRLAVFAPFKKLGLIVIDEEQDMSYKQWDMHPRYDARTVAKKLAEIHHSLLVRGSATPSIESYYYAMNNDYQLLELPALNLKNLNNKSLKPNITVSQTSIVDMKKERWTKNYTCLSKKLKSEIEYALKNKQQSLLFINRQGMSSFSVCQNCKAVLKCPHCDRALIYNRKGYYKCIHCSYKTSIMPKCAKCGGINFKNVGLGTQKVEKEILDLFPSAKVMVADATQAKKHNFQQKIYADFSQGKADILIGTQMISKGWDLPRLSLVGIIDADNLLSFPDFIAEERAFQLIAQVSGRTNRPGAKFPGEVILQTFQTENNILKWAAEKNYEAFYKNEIKEREALSYPPFSQLVKITFQNVNEEKTEKEAQRIYREINLKVKNKKNIQVSAPHFPLIPKVRRRFKKQIVIKIKTQKIPAELKKVLEKLGAGWIIDIDPISII